jgi:hypothetical protein
MGKKKITRPISLLLKIHEYNKIRIDIDKACVKLILSNIDWIYFFIFERQGTNYQLGKLILRPQNWLWFIRIKIQSFRIDFCRTRKIKLLLIFREVDEI